MRHPRAACIAAALLLAGCGPLLGAEIEVPSVRIATPEQSIPGPPAGVPATDLCAALPDGCVPATAAFDFSAEVPYVAEEGVTVDLRMREFVLHLRPPDQGLLGFQVVVDDRSSGRAHVLASWEKGAGAVPADIVVAADSSVDLGPFLSAGRLQARVEVTYDVASPPAAFTAWAEGDFEVVVTVDYGDLF